MASLRQQKGNSWGCNFSHFAEAEHLAIGKFTEVNFHLDNFYIDTTITMMVFLWGDTTESKYIWSCNSINWQISNRRSFVNSRCFRRRNWMTLSSLLCNSSIPGSCSGTSWGNQQHFQLELEANLLDWNENGLELKQEKM